MKIFSLFGEILLKDNGTTNKLDEIDKKAKGTSKSFDDSFSKIKSSALKVGSVLLGGLGIKELVTKTYQFAESASDLGEAQNVVESTFKKSAKSILEWTNTTAKSAGISKTSSMQWSGFMGAMLKSSGVTEESSAKMSKSLVQLTGDMSSFYNIGTSEMWEKIRSGISGEVEPLRALGINMSVANLEAYALAEGIKKPYKEMSQGEQTQLRYNYLMKVTKDAQGDFSKTLGSSFANQVRVAKMNMEDLGRSIGSVVLPYFMKGVTFINENMPKIKEVINGSVNGIIGTVKFVIPKFEEWIKLIRQIASELLPSFGGSSKEVQGKVTDLAKNGLNFITEALTWLKDNIGVVKAGIIGLSTVWAIQKGILLAHNIALVAHNVQMGVKKGLDIFETAQIKALYIQEGIRNGVTWGAVAAQKALNLVMSLNPISLVIIAIGALIAIGVVLYNKSATFRNFVNNLWGDLKSFAKSIPEHFENMKKGVIDKFESIHNKIEEIKNKIKQKIKDMFTFEPPHFKLPHLSLSGKLSLVPPSVPDFSVKWYAKGTDYFQGGLAGINEAGGEIVNLPRGSQIIPHDISMEIAKNRTNNKTEIVFILPDKREVARYIVDPMSEELANKDNRENFTFNMGGVLNG
ncbi:hypothetical protein HMPREF1982_03558 [Clostridiales bacterium oral taxon 876 str. F0540]|nr:hypothetical protein HMPREF1982_03558 [Clostridiales bacterium oral taxon 876 str. F0540]